MKGVMMNEKEFKEKLAALNDESDRYFELNHGECTGRDMSINGISRSIVDLMEAYHGKIYLGKVNDYDRVGDHIYEYSGDFVHNFEYNFAIPVYDSEINSLLKRWNMDNDVSVITPIMDRVNAVDGVWLSWA